MSPVDLCLGTAQFGLPYGITNTSGQVSKPVVSSLLQSAHTSGIRLLDTAQAYGNAEQVLGSSIPPSCNFKIVSKLPAQSSSPFTRSSLRSWEYSFQNSLQRLRLPAIDALLLHQSADLCRPDSSILLEWLSSLRDRGLVRRIGVSIYEGSELDLLPLDHIQLVQLPLSLYDQRCLHNGTITTLYSAGISIHARSIYLQGLLLTPANQLPSWCDPAFRHHHSMLESSAIDAGLTLLSMALDFCRSCESLEAVVVGVTSQSELTALLSGWNRPAPVSLIGHYDRWAWPKEDILDPRRWPR